MDYKTSLTAKIVLDTRSYSKKQKGHPIKIRINYKGRAYVSLNKFCDKKHWNEWVLPSHPDYRRLNDFLSKRQRHLNEEIAYCNENNLDLKSSKDIIQNGLSSNTELQIFLLQQQIDKLRKKNSIGLLEFFDIRIQELQDLGRSHKAYYEARNQFANFILYDDIPISEVTREWIIKFSAYKKSSGCGTQGLRSYLVTLSALINEGIKRPSLNIPKDNPVKGLIPVKNRAKEIVVPEIEVFSKILHHEKGMHTTNRSFRTTIRNLKMFEFQFLVGGHDFVEMGNLKWDNLKNGRIKFKRYKNRNKIGASVLVDNILVERAQEIVSDIGDKDNERVFSFIPEPSSQHYDKYRGYYLKSLSRVAKEYDTKLTSKTPRFMFNSYAAEAGFNREYVRQIQGHAKGKDVSFGYSRRFPNGIVDDVLKGVVGLVY